MTDYKHFPRLPRQNGATSELERSVFWAVIVLSLFLLAFAWACTDDFQVKEQLDKKLTNEELTYLVKLQRSEYEASQMRALKRMESR